MRLHALSKFLYCPVCGSSSFVENDFKSKRCKDCGFTYYLNSSAAVVGVLMDGNGRVLVGRRAFNPAKGTLDFPGGFVDMDETLEQALSRELKEETGLWVELDKWLFSFPNRYLYSGLSIPTVDSFMLCKPIGDKPMTAADDVEELFWLPLADLRPEDFGMDSMRKAIPLLKEILL